MIRDRHYSGDDEDLLALSPLLHKRGQAHSGRASPFARDLKVSVILGLNPPAPSLQGAEVTVRSFKKKAIHDIFLDIMLPKKDFWRTVVAKSSSHSI